MQGVIQKWVDYLISVMVNILEEIFVEMVQKIYEMAWKEGCKGCIIYWDGFCLGVLVFDKEKKIGVVNEFQEIMLLKCFEVFDVVVVWFKNNVEDWIVVIGLYVNWLYEIFIGKLEDIFIIFGYVIKGWVMKNIDDEGYNCYDLQFEDKQGYWVIIEGLFCFFDKEYWNYVKLIFGVFCYGMLILYVVDLVEGFNVEEDYINIWKNGVVCVFK